MSRSRWAASSRTYDIYWLEEPVPADDFAGYQRIAAALDMRVVGGETPFYALRSAAVLPESRACRSCSPTRCAAA